MPTFGLSILLASAALFLPSIADSDGDGVIDSDDRCAEIAGVERHLGCPRPVVLETKVTTPDRRNVVRIKDWRPWPRPTYQQVVTIAAAEQRRWGGPSLMNRILCESGGSWSATNGQYLGLLQFGPIWWSMWPGTPRGVKLKTRKVWDAPVRRWVRWSGGRWTSKVIGRVRQTKSIIRSGRLPRNPDQTHGWAAIRVGQRAVSGDGPTTGWACGL